MGTKKFQVTWRAWLDLIWKFADSCYQVTWFENWALLVSNTGWPWWLWKMFLAIFIQMFRWLVGWYSSCPDAQLTTKFLLWYQQKLFHGHHSHPVLYSSVFSVLGRAPFVGPLWHSFPPHILPNQSDARAEYATWPLSSLAGRAWLLFWFYPRQSQWDGATFPKTRSGHWVR